MSAQVYEEPGIKPASARMYDYYLGGKTNYTVDRDAAAEVLKSWPSVLTAARENRSFMHRAVRCLSREHGIRQFLDIGTGIPTPPNLHEVAQGLHADARIVYADNDPIVLAHDRALTNSTSAGRTVYVEADVREPDRIREAVADTLDLDLPVAVSLVALLHFVPDEDDPAGIVRALMSDLPSGSALVITQGTEELDPRLRDVAEIYHARGMDVVLRDQKDTAALFAAGGVELLEPGLTVSYEWRPDLLGEGELPRLPDSMTPAEAGVWAGVGVKP